MDTRNLCKKDDEELKVGWVGYYTRKNGTVWFRCTIIAFDYGSPVIRTAIGHYYLRTIEEYTFNRHPPEQETRKETNHER